MTEIALAFSNNGCSPNNEASNLACTHCGGRVIRLMLIGPLQCYAGAFCGAW